jgi:hypothetical protein
MQSNHSDSLSGFRPAPGFGMDAAPAVLPFVEALMTTDLGPPPLPPPDPLRAALVEYVGTLEAEVDALQQRQGRGRARAQRDAVVLLEVVGQLREILGEA